MADDGVKGTIISSRVPGWLLGSCPTFPQIVSLAPFNLCAVRYPASSWGRGVVGGVCVVVGERKSWDPLHAGMSDMEMLQVSRIGYQVRPI